MSIVTCHVLKWISLMTSLTKPSVRKLHPAKAIQLIQAKAIHFLFEATRSASLPAVPVAPFELPAPALPRHSAPAVPDPRLRLGFLATPGSPAPARLQPRPFPSVSSFRLQSNSGPSSPLKLWPAPS